MLNITADELGNQRIRRKRDLSTGFDSGTPDHKAALPSSSSTQMFTCWLGPVEGKEEQQCDGTKLTIRASGTEPKIKMYLESWDKDREKARQGTKAVLKAVRVSLFCVTLSNAKLLFVSIGRLSRVWSPP